MKTTLWIQTAFLLGAAATLAAQTPAKLPPSPKAVDIPATDIQAFLKAHPYGDDMMRMIDVGSINAGVSLLRYQKSTAPRQRERVNKLGPLRFLEEPGSNHGPPSPGEFGWKRDPFLSCQEISCPLIKAGAAK